jgi:hypothetical protein
LRMKDIRIDFRRILRFDSVLTGWITCSRSRDLKKDQFCVSLKECRVMFIDEWKMVVWLWLNQWVYWIVLITDHSILQWSVQWTCVIPASLLR